MAEEDYIFRTRDLALNPEVSLSRHNDAFSEPSEIGKLIARLSINQIAEPNLPNEEYTYEPQLYQPSVLPVLDIHNVSPLSGTVEPLHEIPASLDLSDCGVIDLTDTGSLARALLPERRPAAEVLEKASRNLLERDGSLALLNGKPCVTSTEACQVSVKGRQMEARLVLVPATDVTEVDMVGLAFSNKPVIIPTPNGAPAYIQTASSVQTPVTFERPNSNTFYLFGGGYGEFSADDPVQLQKVTAIVRQIATATAEKEAELTVAALGPDFDGDINIARLDEATTDLIEPIKIRRSNERYMRRERLLRGPNRTPPATFQHDEAELQAAASARQKIEQRILEQQAERQREVTLVEIEWQLEKIKIDLAEKAGLNSEEVILDDPEDLIIHATDARTDKRFKIGCVIDKRYYDDTGAEISREEFLLLPHLVDALPSIFRRLRLA